MTAEQEERLFAPLMGVHHLREFDVEVTWPENEHSETLLRDAPFRPMRNGQPTPHNPLTQNRGQDPLDTNGFVVGKLFWSRQVQGIDLYI